MAPPLLGGMFAAAEPVEPDGKWNLGQVTSDEIVDLESMKIAG
jgi:hypothetical protein